MRLITNGDNVNSLKLQLAAEIAGQKLDVHDARKNGKFNIVWSKFCIKDHN